MKKGVLLPIFSLPSKYGIGDFGYEAYEFIKILKENDIDYWEILPINEAGQYPYSPISFYALNKNYISIDKLIEMGLLESAEEIPSCDKIVYDNYKEKYYKKAFKKFKVTEEFLRFSLNSRMQEFAKYMSQIEGEKVEYYLFLQYILDKQWKELKDFANENNVKLIGDLPIYPSFNSCEVKYHSECYELANGKMEYVSGASPDYFNKDGQKWGHPLYNFNEMKKDRYKYLIERYEEFLKKFDIIRIDHFRAFDTYYKIPIEKDAKDGFYVEGPGKDFFDELFNYTTPDRFIVEDLGDIRKETEKLRDIYNFPKMKILQYTINLKTLQDEYSDTDNMVVYTGNHDNNTIIGWYNSLNDIDKENVRMFLINNNCNYQKINVAFIKYCLKSKAKIVIIPVQDIIGLDEKARINVPGDEFGDNWCWKLKDFDKLKECISVLR